MKTDQGWLPFTVSQGYADGIITSSLDANGILTTVVTYKNGPPTSATFQTDNVWQVETIDLDTGAYTFSLALTATSEIDGCTGVPYVDEIDPSTGMPYPGPQDVSAGAFVSGVVGVILSPATPPSLSIAVSNPYSCLILFDCSTLPGTDSIISGGHAPFISADGQSAALIAISSNDAADPVELTVSGPTGFSGAIGSLSFYDPNFLNESASGTTTLKIPANKDSNSNSNYSYCDSSGNCFYLALLWAPAGMSGGVKSTTGSYVPVELTIKATQGTSTSLGTIRLQPPPLVLVHGIWGNPKDWDSFIQWLGINYPLPLMKDPSGAPWLCLICAADYRAYNYLAFSDPNIQRILENEIDNALWSAASKGVVARKVDVVGHSMGGLVTRYFMEKGLPYPLPWMLPNPIHNLVTIGTPEVGSPLAETLWKNQTALLLEPPNPFVAAKCPPSLPKSECSLGDVFANMGKTVSTGISSLIPGNQVISAQVYSAIVGEAPESILPPLPGSCTESVLDTLLLAFLPGQTDYVILGGYPNDTIVSGLSQSAGTSLTLNPISKVVHADLCPIPNVDTEETKSPNVWAQATYWLMGGSGAPPQASSRSTHTMAVRQTQPQGPALPVLDLTGYKQVPSSNVSFSPASNSTLSINSGTGITATSSTKTITEVLLLQTVSDPTDVPFLYSTQSPFTIIFVPTRMGSTTFVAFAVFSDNTFASTTLNYSFQLPGNPLALSLVNMVANLPLGSSAIVGAQALFSNGPVDVSQAATYKVRSGTPSVFSVDSAGTVTANGPGVDWLDVSYNSVSASAQISVGTCAYSLSPTNQLVAYSGGGVSVQVTTQNGCGWTADTGGAAWLRPINASGIGSGTITLTATANTTGATQAAIITVGGQDVAITQPATSCAYTLNETQISALGTGASGSISVTTSCPIVISSSAPWVTVTPLSSSVAYNVAANTGSSPRSASITIGNQTVTVNQAGLTPTFSVSANPSTVSISSPGESGSTSITVAPSGGFTGSVNLSCSVAFAGTGAATDSPTCSLSPSQVNITESGGATSTLNISTTAPQSAALRREQAPSGRGLVARGGLAILFCVCLFGVSTRRREWSSIMGLVITIALIGTVACGGNGGAGGGGGGNKNPGTTIGSYTVTVSAMGGGVSSSSSVTVTLQ